jgi:hypothetical protein
MNSEPLPVFFVPAWVSAKRVDRTHHRGGKGVTPWKTTVTGMRLPSRIGLTNTEKIFKKMEKIKVR